MKFYSLFLNPMRERAEALHCVARCSDRNKLIAWMEQYRAETPWIDNENLNVMGNPYTKAFKKGSPLEWYNPADLTNSLFGEGIQESEFDIDEAERWLARLRAGEIVD